MRTSISVRPACKLSSAEIRQCRDLTLRQKGLMQYDLSDWRWDVRTYVLRLTDETGKLLAWALVLPNRGNYYGSKLAIELYTRVSERRKGYATRLFKLAEKRFGVTKDKKKLITYPDPKSREFFKSVGAVE